MKNDDVFDQLRSNLIFEELAKSEEKGSSRKKKFRQKQQQRSNARREFENKPLLQTNFKSNALRSKLIFHSFLSQEFSKLFARKRYRWTFFDNYFQCRQLKIRRAPFRSFKADLEHPQTSSKIEPHHSQPHWFQDKDKPVPSSFRNLKQRLHQPGGATNCPQCQFEEKNLGKISYGLFSWNLLATDNLFLIWRYFISISLKKFNNSKLNCQ